MSGKMYIRAEEFEWGRRNVKRGSWGAITANRMWRGVMIQDRDD